MKRIGESELLRLADLNLVEYWCESARWMPGSEILQTRDSVLIDCPLDFPSTSIAFCVATDHREDPAEFVARARAFYKGRKKAFSIMLRAHEDRATVDYCRENKMFALREAPGMVLDAPLKEIKTPAGAAMRIVSNEDDLRAFGLVVTEAFEDLGLPQSVGKQYFEHPQRVLSPYLHAAIAYYEGEPASAALATLSHGIAGIYWVGTTKKARGKGLAAYCTGAVGNAAFEMGARKVILQASQFGEPVYLKMGYRQFTTYPWFVCTTKG